jgi:RNA polymerase sigma factor (TIGR02999 family)
MNPAGESHPKPASPETATNLLVRVSEGDSDAAAELLPLVYDQLRALAGSQFRGERADHTLQPTALVHEAYIKLINVEGSWKDRAHFCAIAASAMRKILMNHAREKRAAKRSGRQVDITIDALATPSGKQVLDLVALDDALTELTELNERFARIVELRFFGGLEVEDIAACLGVSSRTIRNDWRAARAWMARAMSTEGA